jgi:predicted phage tail component-like protein
MGMTFNGVHSSIFKVHFESQPAIPLTGEIKDYYEDIAGKNGSFLFPQPFGDKIIKVSCLLLSDSKEERVMLAKKVARWLVTTHRTQIVFDEDPSIYHVGKIEKQIDFESLISFGKFEVIFRCEPFSYGTNQNELNWFARNNTAMQIVTEGTAEIKPKVIIFAKYGFLNGITLEVNGYTFIYNGEISANGKIYIDSKYFTVSTNPNLDSNLTGIGLQGQNSMLNQTDGSFPIMQGGENSFLFNSLNGNSADITIQWEDTFL